MNVYMLNFQQSIFSFVTHESDKNDLYMQCPGFRNLDPPKRRESFFPTSPSYLLK